MVLDRSNAEQARIPRDAGQAMREIAATVGVSEATLYRALRS